MQYAGVYSTFSRTVQWFGATSFKKWLLTHSTLATLGHWDNFDSSTMWLLLRMEGMISFSFAFISFTLYEPSRTVLRQDGVVFNQVSQHQLRQGGVRFKYPVTFLSCFPGFQDTVVISERYERLLLTASALVRRTPTQLVTHSTMPSGVYRRPIFLLSSFLFSHFAVRRFPSKSRLRIKLRISAWESGSWLSRYEPSVLCSLRAEVRRQVPVPAR